jgi:hypothetical protein
MNYFSKGLIFILVFIFSLHAQKNLTIQYPDTLHLKSGSVIPCLIKEVNTQFLEVFFKGKKNTILVKLLDKIFIRDYGLIDLPGPGLQIYMESPRVEIPEEQKYVENPDTLYLKSGDIYPCFIEEMDEKKIAIKYKNQNNSVMTKLINKIYLRDKGIIYPSDPEFQQALVVKEQTVPQKAEDVYLQAKSPSRRTMKSLGGGISLPSGEGSKYWNTGFTFYGDILFPLSSSTYLGGRVAYNRWTPDANELASELVGYTGNSGLRLDVSGAATIFEITPSLRFVSSSAANPSFKFFTHIGIGIYILNLEAEGKLTPEGGYNYVDFSLDESKTKFGLNFGLGVVLDIVTIYPLYNIVFTEDESTKYFSIILGLGSAAGN